MYVQTALMTTLVFMVAKSVDASLVRWTVGGIPATQAEAIVALESKPLLVLMHGFGSFEGDLIGLAPQLPLGVVCASPRAPLVAPEPIVGGYSWWPLSVGANGMPLPVAEPTEFVGSGPHKAALAVFEWLDTLEQQVAQRNGGAGISEVAIMGFSQGGCLVTSMLRLQPERFACGVNCSGFVAPGANDDSAIAALKPSLFWGRDEADPIISADRVERTAIWSEANTNLEARLYDGILHGIGQDELRDISNFLNANMARLTVGQR